MGVDLATYRARIGGHYHRLVYAARTTGPVLTGWVIFWILVGTLLLISGLDPNPVITGCVVAVTVFWAVLFSNKKLPHPIGDDNKVILTSVQRLHTKALKASDHRNKLPEEQEITTIQSAMESDISLWNYLRELNIDTLSKHFMDFSKNERVVSELTKFIRFLVPRIIEKLGYPIHLVKVGSCIDGTKVEQIDEIDTLAIIDSDVKVREHPHKKNRYLLFNNENQEIKSVELIERLADVIDSVARTWVPPGNLKHGGFASPNFCGVRYNGPAVTLLFTYEPDPDEIIDLSVDVTLAFKVPTNHSARQQVVERLLLIQKTLKDRLVEKEDIHFVPDVVHETWLMSTSKIEADLFHGLSTDVPIKRAYCLTKLISNNIKHNSAGIHSSFPEDPHVSNIIGTWKETSDIGSARFSDIKKLMRHAHSFLSADNAKEHHECEKRDISMNTAALKHALLANALENTELFRQSPKVDDIVYKLVEETFMVFSQTDQWNVPHALVENCNIRMFSLSKSALLSDKVDQLLFMMKLKCKAIHSKVRTQSTEPSEDSQVDPQTGAIEILKKYLVPTEDILPTCAATYVYQVQVDPSVSPKRSKEVTHINMMINGLQNSCGGIIAISCDTTFSEDTQKEWQDMFLKEVPSGVEHLDTIDFKKHGILLDTLCIKSSKSLVSMTDDRIEFHLRGDGWFEMRESSSSPRKQTLPNYASESDDSNAWTIQKTDAVGGEEILGDTPQTDNMLSGARKLLLSEYSELRSGVSISYKKGRVLKPRTKKCDLTEEIVRSLSIFRVGNPAHYSPPKEALTDRYDAVSEQLNYIEHFTEHNACVLVFADILDCLDKVHSSYETATIWDSDIPKPILDVVYFDVKCQIIFNSIYEGTNSVLCHKRTFQASQILSKYMTDVLKNQPSDHAEFILRIYPCTYVLGATELPSIQTKPCGLSIPCIKMSLAKLLLHDNTTFRDRINNDMSIYLTSQQLDKVFGLELVSLGVIEGPPGSGKTLLEQHLCKRFGKDKSMIFCPNKGVEAYINHQQIARAVWINHVCDVVEAIETSREDLVYVIIDDVQYVEYDEKVWRQLFNIAHSSKKHLYMFMDSKYQTHRGEENVQSIRALVAHTKEGCILPPLREIYRNSQVVVDYMEKTAFGDDEGEHFDCCSPIDSDDVEVTSVRFLKGKSAQNGLLLHVKNLIESKHYKPTDVAVLFESDSKVLPLIKDTFCTFASEIQLQNADEYPIRGLIIDYLTRFEGLEAVCLVMVLEDEEKVRNSKFKTMIASRGVKRVEFVQEETFDIPKMEMLHFNPHTMADDEILREEELEMENELTVDDDELLHACRNGDLKFLQTTLADESEVDQIRSGRTGITLLVAAAYWGYDEIVQWLLQKGSNVNTTDKCRRTALYHACIGGSMNVVDELVRAGADVDTTDKWGDTALYRACISGRIDVVQELVRAGASLKNGRRNLVNTAAENGRLDVVKWLLEQGVGMKSINYAPNLACTNGHMHVVQELFRAGARLEHQDSNAILRAAELGGLSVVKWILTQGVDVNTTYEGGRTALFHACSQGRMDVVQELVRAGASLEYGDKNYLHGAAEKGSLDGLEWILEQGADINTTDKEGRTPLLVACYHGNLKVAKYLLKRGGKTHIGTKNALTEAARGCCTGVVQWLLDIGEDANITDDQGNTPLWHVEQLKARLQRELKSTWEIRRLGELTRLEELLHKAEQQS